MQRIVSGGQSGVDRAALDVALALGLPCGGWCPKGRKAEDGIIADRYPLTETPSDDYAKRTEWNVRDSDGTLVLVDGLPMGGTAYTIAVANEHGKPCLAIDLNSEHDASRQTVRDWLSTNAISTLNVAGPRADGSGAIYARARSFLEMLLRPDPDEAGTRYLFNHFRKDHMAQSLGIEIIDIQDGRATVRMCVEQRHCNSVDIAHGGALFTQADYAMAIASNTRGFVAVAINASINYIKAVKGGLLYATAVRVSESRRTASYRIDVADTTSTIVAIMQGTVYHLRDAIPGGPLDTQDQ